ncbi:ankyrin repeat domain-containing protein 6-like [Centruroides vittatus]|uniref:ankyrin repeat domain-containing protein 6-like n=1 Tax=Centruroides vittatus TaxID=120091 RepID=UPI00350FD8E6
MIPVPTLRERLRQAAIAGQPDRVKEYCRLGVAIEPDEEGRTALHLAAANGHVDIVKILLHYGAKVNTADVAGYTPLHQASTEGHVEVVRLLLKNGSHVDAQDEHHGNTALHEAAWKGYSQTLEVLCKHKANVYILNKGGFSALHLACQNGHNQSCRVILLSGCKPDIKNNYGDTPLHTASRYGHAGVLRILISAFCHTSELNKNGDTALHIAAAMGRRKLTRILLEAGCDQMIRNKQGERAIDIAERKEFTEVQNILLNPPPKVIHVQQKSKDEKKQNKKRDKGSGTSQGSKDSTNKQRRDKHKKSKHGHKVHFMDEGKKNVLWNGHWSPYGCPMFPNMADFPSPKLDSLPPEPLKKGEQYYIDLEGNIKKGPVGVGYSCYCAPFFQHVEKKMEVDKQEIMDHIDHAHDDLNDKIASLERRTRTQILNINQTMKEKLATERAECIERIERRSMREKLELEKVQQQSADCIRKEMKSWVHNKFSDIEDRKKHDENIHHNHNERTHLQQSLEGIMRTKSESESDDSESLQGTTANNPILSYQNNNNNNKSEAANGCNDRDDHPPVGQVQRLRTDFEKLGARPKYFVPTSYQCPNSGSNINDNKDSKTDSKAESESINSDLRTGETCPQPLEIYVGEHPKESTPDSGYHTKMSPRISESSGSPYCQPLPSSQLPPQSYHSGIPSQLYSHCHNGHNSVNHNGLPPASQYIYNEERRSLNGTHRANNSSHVHFTCVDHLCKLNEGLNLSGDGSSLV